MSGPSIGALFAGVGGFELAAQNVWPGAHTAWLSEFDAAASRVLAARFPGVVNLGDVTKIDWSQVAPVDIITGGSPCQDLSHAGKRAGMRAGTRSGLWASMTDAIDILRPRLVIWENVRGALSAPASSASDLVDGPGPMGDRDGGHLRALGRVLGDLADIGYDAAWVGLRAADVGAPHGRFRIFVLAWPQGDASALTWPQGDASALLPTPVVNDMGRAYTPDAWDEWTARLKASHGNGNGHGASLNIETLRLLKTPTAQLAVNGGSQHPDKRSAGGHGPTLADEVEHLLPTPTTEPTTGNGHARNLGGEVRALLPTPRATDGTKGGPNQRGSSGDLMLPSAVLLPTPTSTDSRASGATYAATDTHHTGTTLTDATVRRSERFGQYAPAIARWEPITRPAPAPTEPRGKNGAHRLSPRFVEWMQGFPDGWVTDVPGVSHNEQLKVLGNSVVWRQAAEGIRWLLGVRAAVREQVPA